MWEKIVWIHPVKRRFIVHTGLTGTTLQQEVTGSQVRIVIARGVNQTEFAGLVQEHEATPFIAEYDFSAEPTFRHGFESFDANVSGRRLVPANQQDTGSSDGSYEYYPASAALT